MVVSLSKLERVEIKTADERVDLSWRMSSVFSEAEMESKMDTESEILWYLEEIN